jgi:hypothetical protein
LEEQITYARPLRRTILQPSQIRFTLARTFTDHTPFINLAGRENTFPAPPKSEPGSVIGLELISQVTEGGICGMGFIGDF